MAAVVAVFCLARLYLAVDHPDDVLLGVALGVAIPVTAFRFFTPNEVFPVVYRRGRTAHLDVTGRRGEAIRQAVRDQLGLTVLEIKPVGLESSAGSTPLRLRVEGGPDEYLFAKLYTKGHVRADRWYKLWRTILYGSLEDERPSRPCGGWSSTRTTPCACCRTSGSARPGRTASWRSPPSASTCWSPSSSTAPSRSARPTSTTQVIDQGLLLIRKLWDAGIAHRDIKPGNLMVRDGELLLIDVAFVQVRPSPWRQAVDLGNMMLVLAVRTDPERVYRRALRYFTAGRARRGVRRHPRGRQPDPAARVHEAGPARPARRVPRPRPAAAADRAAALERPAGRPGRSAMLAVIAVAVVDRRQRASSRRAEPGRLRPRVRHRPLDDPGRPGGPVRGAAALRRRAPVGLADRRRRHRQRAGQLLAGLRPGRAAGRRPSP